MKKNYRKIEGILHDIDLSLVTQKYLDSIAAGKGETVEGYYVPNQNRIYVSKDLNSQAQLHTALHEVYHMFKHHIERMDDEAAADAFSAWLIRLFKLTSIEEIIKNEVN